MKLHLREIGAALSDASLAPVIAPGTPLSDGLVWLDSSLDLERGLEVVELSVDPSLSDLQAPPSALPPLSLKQL